MHWVFQVLLALLAVLLTWLWSIRAKQRPGIPCPPFTPFFGYARIT
jgi:hypothetical protein